MGNRHHHKKLRAEVRARMARTGESYQRALARILDERAGAPPAREVDLLAFEYFGVPATLATFEVAGRLACVAVSSRLASGTFPRSVLLSLAPVARRVVH
jgi:hypothetical protein